jgi:DNA-binding transcriptional LysR family regulator
MRPAGVDACGRDPAAAPPVNRRKLRLPGFSVSLPAGMTDRLDIIAIFAAVAEQGSFAEAARRLGRTPAAVTRAVATLEGQLKTRLLNRTTRAVSLTDDGARYLEVCHRLLGAYQDLQALDIGSEAPPHGTLHVTAPALFGRLHVLPVITSFLARHPQVDVRAAFLDRVVSLIEEGFDVGVRLGNLPDSSLRAITVGHVHMAVYGSPDYLARHGTPEAPDDLARHAIISCSGMTNVPEHWPFESGRGIDGVTVKPRLVVNTADAAAEAAASGHGLTYLVSYQVEALVTSGRLREVLANHIAPSFPVQIVHPAGRFVPTRVRHFIDHATTELRRTFAPA